MCITHLHVVYHFYFFFIMEFSALNITVFCYLNKIFFFLMPNSCITKTNLIFRVYYGLTKNSAFHIVSLTETVLPKKGPQRCSAQPRMGELDRA